MSEQHETVAITGPYRLAASVAKYSGDKQPGDEPIETTEAVSWHDADGTAITDPERIRVLEERLAAREADTHREWRRDRLAAREAEENGG